MAQPSVSPKPYEEILESKNIFLDSQEALYPSSDRIQFDFNHPIDTNQNEKIRLSVAQIYGSKPYHMINTSNRYYYVMFDTDDGQYMVRMGLPVFDYQSEYAVAHEFIQNLQNPSQIRTIPSIRPNVADDSQVSSSDKIDVFSINFSNTVDDAVNTLKSQNKKDTSFEREIFANLKNFNIEVKYDSSSTNGAVYSFTGNKSGTRSYAQKVLNHISILYPSNKNNIFTFDYNDTYLLAGGLKTDNTSSAQELYTQEGLLQSCANLQNNDNGKRMKFEFPNGTYNGSLGDVIKEAVLKDDSGAVIGRNGYDFEKNVFELEVPDETKQYTFNLNNLRGFSAFIAFVRYKEDNNTYSQPVSPVSKTDVEEIGLHNDDIVLYHPYDQFTASGDSTITFDGSDLNKSRIVWFEHINPSLQEYRTGSAENLTTIVENANFYNKDHPLFIQGTQYDYFTTVEQDFWRLFDENYMTFTNGGNNTDFNFIFNRQNSLDTFTVVNDKRLNKRGQDIFRGMYSIHQGSDELHISSWYPMAFTSQPYTYLRMANTSGNMGSSVLNPRVSQNGSISPSQIVARATNHERIISHNNLQTSPDTSNNTGYFFEITSSNLNYIEMSLTDHKGRNMMPDKDAFESGSAFLNVLLRMDRIRINKSNTISTDFSENRSKVDDTKITITK